MTNGEISEPLLQMELRPQMRGERQKVRLFSAVTLKGQPLLWRELRRRRRRRKGRKYDERAQVKATPHHSGPTCTADAVL